MEGAAVYFQEQPYITEWFTEEQVAEVREKETQVYEHLHGLIDRGIASGEFYPCDSHVLALGYIGMTLGAYRWLRPDGRRSAELLHAGRPVLLDLADGSFAAAARDWQPRVEVVVARAVRAGLRLRAVLVDATRTAPLPDEGLDTIEPTSDGGLRIGAMVRNTDLVATAPRRLLEAPVSFEGVVVLDAPRELPPVPHSIWWHPRFDGDPAHTWLREQLRVAAAAPACPAN